MIRFCDELEFAFGWFDEEDRLRRTSHALLDGDGVWLIDPVASEDAISRARSLGELRGVIQLLDRHDRDARELSEQLAVPLHRVPRRSIYGASFEFPNVLRTRFWDEVALWSPERRTLVAADALGTVAYFRPPRDQLGVHPFLRLWPPRSLRPLFPEHVLVGHGKGVHEHAAELLHEALRTSRRRLPAALANGFRAR